MTCGQVIEFLNGIVKTAIEKNLYEISISLIEIEQKILEKYKLTDEVEVTYFTECLQKSIDGLSPTNKEILLPILRELKLNTIL